MGERKIEQVIKSAVEKLSDEEKNLAADWAQKALVIKNDSSLTTTKKLMQLSRLNTPTVIISLVKSLSKISKDFVWTDQSWARRLGLIGLAAGTATVGSKMAGVAALGSATAVPLMLLTTMGTTFIGVLLDEISKSRSKKD